MDINLLNNPLLMQTTKCHFTGISGLLISRQPVYTIIKKLMLLNWVSY